MAFSYPQFDEFRETMKDFREIHQHTAFRFQKWIQNPTAAKGLALVYTPNELELLHKMRDTVSEKVAAEKLLALELHLN